MTEKQQITVKTVVEVPVEKAWEVWTKPHHIMAWNHASEEWRTPHAENDLRTGGKFLFRMEARDGSFGFDFTGVYDEVALHKTIAYTMEDGRQVVITFKDQGDKTEIIETFDAESENSIETQRNGWQAIMNSYKKYAEGL